MINTSLNRDKDSCLSKVSIEEELDVYYVDSTGARVTADSSVNLLNTYCQTLPDSKYVFTHYPYEYSNSTERKKHGCACVSVLS